MNNKVTVIVPVYNTKKYLEECVNSIVGQTYKNIEVLLIDDGSTDGTSDLCDELAKKDDRISVIHKENGGAASARNLGIDEAKGEYIMFIDSDDWFSTDAIEALVAHADKNNTDIIRFSYVREFEGKQLPKKNTFLEERVYKDDECMTICRQILGLVKSELTHPENMNFLASCGFNMYRTSLLKNSDVRFIPIKEIGSFVDGLFNFGIFMNVKRFEFIDKPYYHYRKTNESAATARYRCNYVNRQLILFQKIKDIINENGKWEFFKEAYNNRLVFSVLEISINAILNKAPFHEKYKEIKDTLKNKEFKESYNSFKLEYLGLKWKVYFFFIKHSMTLPTYLMTSLMLKLMSRGVL